MTERESSTGKHGGKRPNAGRKKSRNKHDAPHRTRPSLSPKHPVHVVFRVARWVPRLRQGRAYRAMRKVLVRYLGRDDFRVVHISIQKNHLHLLVEAANRAVLTHSMQSFAINAARAINASFHRSGRVFAFRYHATQILTPRQARNSLAYVLNNWRRHSEDLANERTLAAALDPYASGYSFTGWARGRIELPPNYTPLPVSPPRTKLLVFDWELFGLIDMFEVPGPSAYRDMPSRDWPIPPSMRH